MQETVVSARITPTIELPNLLFSNQVGYYASGYVIIRFGETYYFSAQCESLGIPLHQHLKRYVSIGT